MSEVMMRIKKSGKLCYSLPYAGTGAAPWPNGYFRVLIGNAIQFMKESSLERVKHDVPVTPIRKPVRSKKRWQ